MTNPIDSILKDLRFAVRLMVRQPLLTAAAALTVAFGVGANTAIVSVLETVLLNPLGLRHAEPVMSARVRLDRIQMRHAPVSGVEFRELQSMTDAFSAVAATEGNAQYQNVNVQLMDNLKSYYEFRHDGKSDGLKELIAKYKKK